MNFNDLKRKAFFWIEKLQISKKERIAFSLLLVLITLLLLSTFFIQQQFNYSQEKYNHILAELEAKETQAALEEKQLAAKYTPAQEVNEPEPEQAVAAEETDDVANPEPDANLKVNINTATVAQLQTLNGIGPAYARRIIEYREANDGFDSIEELINVNGIGETRLENIRPFITLND
ncbi:ComEA family DNA-binding protein [Gracilimonas sp.]|uniref:ComEA family DNA-binding protein n=1 Tax=Gracilimonas sp. TaxID=1974203 RepID=UPI00287131F5|nr:helix-hairpin-helix domain-containing protein [Gracilimonas sp.]